MRPRSHQAIDRERLIQSPDVALKRRDVVGETTLWTGQSPMQDGITAKHRVQQQFQGGTRFKVQCARDLVRRGTRDGVFVGLQEIIPPQRSRHHQAVIFLFTGA